VPVAGDDGIGIRCNGAFQERSRGALCVRGEGRRRGFVRSSARRS